LVGPVGSSYDTEHAAEIGKRYFSAALSAATTNPSQWELRYRRPIILKDAQRHAEILHGDV
jgi:hypothetical protein